MMADALWWLVFGILLGWIASWAFARADLRTVIESVPDFGAGVERIVERPIDNPALVARLAELEQQSGVIDALRKQVRTLEAARSSVEEAVAPNTQQREIESQRIFDRERIETLNLEVVEWRERFVELERRAADQQSTIAALETQLAELSAASPAVAEDISPAVPEPAPAATVSAPSQSIDLAAAQAAGFDLMSAESLEIIEGVGPRIAAVLNERGIRTLQQLANMTAGEIRELLDTAGPNLRLVNPASWPAQAALAVANRWEALATLQQALAAQKRRESSGT